MNIKQITNILIDGGISPDEAKAEIRIMLEHFWGYDLKKEVMGEKLTDEQLEFLKDKADYRVKTGLPVQYITGFAYFMGEKFLVNKDVLIPRDETEILVRESVRLIKENNLQSALEIGAGSGCISCMCAKLSGIQVLGVDISNEALRVAIDNATRLNLFNKAIFRKSDVYSKVYDYEKFDIIISNPPYIPLKEKNNLQKEVQYEPDTALFTKDELGLEFYERIIKDAHKYLLPNGCVAFEIGINQAQYVKEILETNGFANVNIIKDLAGIERVISAQIIV